MNKPLPSDPFESLEDEISSLNFGLQEDISIKNSEVEYYQFLSQICEEYKLESALQQDSTFLATDVYTSFTSLFSQVFVLDKKKRNCILLTDHCIFIRCI